MLFTFWYLLCYEGFEMKMEDWEILLRKHPNFFYVIKLYKGKQVIEVFSNGINNKMFTKSRKIIN